jgi:hypothetical protein
MQKYSNDNLLRRPQNGYFDRNSAENGRKCAIGHFAASAALERLNIFAWFDL